MGRFARAYSILLTAGALRALVGAAQAERPTLRIPRVSRPPALQDFLRHAPREAEAPVTGFRQWKPGDGLPVSQETAAYLSYDNTSLYVIFVCKDEPGKVRARMTKREDIDNDDQVVVNLDTFHDHHRAYTFASNPFGIQQDSIFTEGQSPDFSFDTVWHSEGRLTEDGYVVWMAIPFRSLRFSSAPVQDWGIALGRSIVRKNEFSTWPYITQRIESYLQQMATLAGLEQISPGRNLQFIPYGMFTRTRFLDAQAPAFRTENDGRAGLDAKAVLRDALTLDVALNPDFSQVESDEPQVTVNRRFEVFFPERRPFFIENAGFFETPLNLAAGYFEAPVSLFFSRRIADPQCGARLTGKLGHWILGALAIDDRAPGKRLRREDPLYARRAAIGAVRLRRDFAGQSSIGLLITSRDFASSSNRVFSLDTRLRLNPNWTVSGQLMRSYTRELDASRRSGPGYYARAENTGLHFRYFGRYFDFSPDFRSEVGFIRRVDIRQTEHLAAYRWKPEGRRVVGFEPSVSALVNWDRHGRVQDWIAGAGAELELTGQTRLVAWRNEAFELFHGLGFRKNANGASFSTDWLKWLGISANYNQGKSLNYYPAAPREPFPADSADGSLGLTLRPTPQVRFGQTYIYSRLGTPRQSIFNNHILRSKLNYQFTRALSVRAILDYNAVLPNPSLVDLERSKRFAADFLLTYLVNPGTALYVGYLDTYENLAIDPTMPATLRRTGSPHVSTGRQFFVKLSYLLRF